LLSGCAASVSDGIGRLEDIERPAAGRLLRRVDGRADFIVALRGRETRDFGLAVEDFGLAEVALAVDRLAAVPDVAVLVEREVERTVVRFAAIRGLLTLGLAEADFGFAVEDRRAVDALRAVEARLTVVAATGLAVCMALAAVVRALAAVAMALVAVFIDRMADDIVLADVLALVAAAVILLAAVVTLVAAEDTFLAAVAGVAVLLAEALPRVVRDAVLLVERAGLRVEPAAVLRDRDVVLRLDRLAGLRVVDEAVPTFLAAVLRVLLGFALALVFGRLAVPDALRLTDLLRAVLAELRRLAARVVVLTGTEFSPRLDQLRWCYSTCGPLLHTQRFFAEDNVSQYHSSRPAGSLRRVTASAAARRAVTSPVSAPWQSPCAFSV
jgi:hypothetical protein